MGKNQDHVGKVDPRTEEAREKHLAIYADLLMRVSRHEICKKHDCCMRTVERAVKWVRENALEIDLGEERSLLIGLMEKLSERLHDRVENMPKGTGYAQAETAYIKQLLEIEKYLAELRGLHRMKVEVEHTGEVKVEHTFDPDKERAILGAASIVLEGGASDTGGAGEAAEPSEAGEGTPCKD